MKKIDDFLRMMDERNASDLILTLGSAPVLKIYSQLLPTQLPAVSPALIQGLVNSLLDEEKDRKLKAEGQICFIYSLAGLSRYRITIFKQRKNYALGVRRIPSKLPSLEELNLSRKHLEMFCNFKHGLILIASTLGEGKTTTMAALLSRFNEKYKYHIITIEEPIEYVFNHNKCIIEQRSIGEDAPSLSSALKDITYELPDIVVIGEIKNAEATQLCLELAEKGVLIISTICGDSCIDVVRNITGFSPDLDQNYIRWKFAHSLRGIICQQLVPSVKNGELLPCWEVLVGNEKVSTVIKEGNFNQLQTILETSLKDNMQSMDIALLELYNRKLISREQLLLRVKDKSREEIVRIKRELEYGGLERTNKDKETGIF